MPTQFYTKLDIAGRPAFPPSSIRSSGSNYETTEANNMGNVTMGNITLPNVRVCEVVKDGNITQIPTPTYDSNNAVVIDMLGVTRVIKVEGEIIGDFEDIRAMTETLYKLIDGNQQSRLTFYSIITGDVEVLSANLRIRLMLPGTIASYTLTLMEGTIEVDAEA